MKQLLVFLLATCVATLSTCAQPGKKVFHKAIANLGAADFAKLMKESKNHILLDVRTKEEFDEGHLANSLNINVFDDDFKAKAAKLDKAKPIFVYCYGGGRSEEASDILAEMGFSRIVNLLGGYRDWTKARLEVVK